VPEGTQARHPRARLIPRRNHHVVALRDPLEHGRNQLRWLRVVGVQGHNDVVRASARHGVLQAVANRRTQAQIARMLHHFNGQPALEAFQHGGTGVGAAIVHRHNAHAAGQASRQRLEPGQKLAERVLLVVNRQHHSHVRGHVRRLSQAPASTAMLEFSMSIRPFVMLVAAAWALPAGAFAQTRLGALAQSMRTIEFDPQLCFRVRELNFQKEDAKFFLTDGYLVFSKPVAGLPVAAAFTAEVEGGEAELLLLPPSRSERNSLASFAKSPNLEERIQRAVFLFTDTTGKDLLDKIAAAEVPFKQSSEMGLVLQQRFESVARNLAASFEVRMMQDLLSTERQQKGLFYAALGGATLGNFDLFADQRGRRLLTLGQLVTRETGTVFDVWTQFEGRSRREQKGPRAAATEWDPRLDDFRIEATIHPDLRLEGTTRVKATLQSSGEGAIPFEISPRVQVTAARVDGEPAEVYRRESMRSTLMSGGSNELLLLVPATPPVPGRTYEIELQHTGSVIREAGNGVFYVAARSNWYPQRGLQLARYDVRFRYPKALTLVSAGEPAEDATEGDWRVTRWRPSAPLRLLGFNLGRFERNTQERGAYKLTVFANRLLEGVSSTAPPPSFPPPPSGFPPRRRMEPPVMAAPPPPPPSPLARLERMSGDLAETFDFLATRLGPPPLKQVNVTPIPGRFGQGFPGLLYLSTLSYLDPAVAQRTTDGPLYFEILQAHEIAHQWWGNLVTPAAMEDDWMMEAFANYTALLYVERKRGTKAIDGVLDHYRRHLLQTGEDDKTLESTGPIIWGTRLTNSNALGAWQAITYEKGSWILHMLRRRLGDAPFQKLLSEVVRRFSQVPLTNQDLLNVAAELNPALKPSLTSFFDTWIYGTGLPELRLQHKVAAGFVTGTVTQTAAGEDFTAEVPIEIQLGRGRTLTHWVRTASEPVDFRVKLPPGTVAAQVKVALDPGGWLLRR